jgi:hypothetical protein
MVERTGVLVLRAWVQRGIGTDLRIRITGTRDVTKTKGADVAATASTPEQVCEVVHAWLDDIAGRSTPNS